MAASKSADSLIAELSESIRRELVDALGPIVKRIAEAVGELGSVVTGGRRRRRRGRPKGTGKRGPGRPPKKRLGRPPKAKPGPKPGKKRGRPGRPPKAKPGRPKGSRKATRVPRGALKATITEILSRSGEPMKLARIRDAVLQTPAYRGRNGKALYTQIIITINKMPEVVRTAKGEYTLKGRK